MVNRLGSWKLCGFEFSCDGNEGDGVDLPTRQSSIPPLCQPQLDYCAPEVVMEVGFNLYFIEMILHY